jgi:putative ABC transport system permease protein
MGIRMLEGRSFSKDHPTDAKDAFIVNEEAVRAMGLKSPVGKYFRLYGQEGQIIGVMQNACFSSLRQSVEPLVYHVLTSADDARYGAILVKLQSGKTAEGIAIIEDLWKRENPHSPFDFQFLDDAVNSRYMSESRTGMIFSWFASLAIFISCLGLFGLASFAAEQRTKEIGIRKVLGSSVASIVILLSKEFTSWVIVANVIAWPIAWYAMNAWLQRFAYRIGASWWVFVLAGGIALVIALLTISYQAVRAAMANPVEALRYE